MIQWTSSNESVATVDDNGVVTMVGVGSAKITAKSIVGKKTATCTITVDTGQTLSVVISVSTGLDSEGYATDVLNFYQAGEIKSLAKSKNYQGEDWVNLSAGDVVCYTTNAAGEINYLHRIFGFADRELDGESDGNEYVFDYVTESGSSYIKLSSGKKFTFALDGTNVLWDTTRPIKKGLSTKTGVSYLKAPLGDTYYYVLARVKSGKVVELVSYKVVIEI